MRPQAEKVLCPRIEHVTFSSFGDELQAYKHDDSLNSLETTIAVFKSVTVDPPHQPHGGGRGGCISVDVYTGQRSRQMSNYVSNAARSSYHVMHGAGHRLIVGLDEVVHQGKLLHCQQKLWFIRCYGLSF